MKESGVKKSGEKDKVLQDLRNFTLEEPNRQFPGLRRFFLLVVGIIALILMVSYVFVTFPIADILQGKMQSTLIQDNLLIVGDIAIVLEDSVHQGLQQVFVEQQKTEFSACLQGKVEKKGESTTYQITSFYLPAMYRRFFNQVVFASCSSETVALLHSHPYKRCAASSTDLRTLKKAQEVNPQVLMLVMCEKGRMAVYS